MLLDRELVEIEKRVRAGGHTDQDILHLLERAKQSHLFQTRYEESLEELEELRVRLNDIGVQVTDLENVIFNAN